MTPDLPTWRYYADGRSVIVHTPAEYAALEPGHADNPGGPFPTPPLDRSPGQAEEEAPLLTPEGQRAQAQALREEGLSRRAIAEALGVTEYTVRRLLEDP